MKKTLVFLIEYRIEVEDSMEVQLGEILEKMRETGSARIIDSRIDHEEKRK